jgi:hypothetical protein
MAATRGISRRDLFKLSLLICGSALLAACQHLISPPAPDPTLIPAVDIPAARLPTLTPRPTPPPTATSLTCVHLLTPENGAALPAMGRVTFSWEPMPEAAAYWLEIRLPNGQTATFDSTGSRDLYLEAFRMDGVFYWQVSALGHGGGLLCTSDPFVFEKGD